MINVELKSIIIYSTSTCQTRVDVFVEDKTVWLTQKSLAELLDTSTQNITIHRKYIYEDAELQED